MHSGLQSDLPSLLAYAVVVIAVPVKWYLVYRLLRLSRAHPSIASLRERALSAVHLAVVITVFAVVFLNNGMEAPVLDLPMTQLLTRSAILSLTIPAIRWLLLYRDE